jgi:hypothetical protein
VGEARQGGGVEDVVEDEVEAAVVEEGIGHGAVRRTISRTGGLRPATRSRCHFRSPYG